MLGATVLIRVSFTCIQVEEKFRAVALAHKKANGRFTGPIGLVQCCVAALLPTPASVDRRALIELTTYHLDPEPVGVPDCRTTLPAQLP